MYTTTDSIRLACSLFAYNVIIERITEERRVSACRLEVLLMPVMMARSGLAVSERRDEADVIIATV